MLDTVKAILDISGSEYNEKLNIYIDYAQSFVKSYCNLSEIPENLITITAFIASSLYSNDVNMKSISLGDVSVAFEKNQRFDEFRQILNKFRKVGF